MTFYDEHPFQFVENDAIERTYPNAFRAFLDAIQPRSRVLDLGCGPGRNLSGLSRRATALGVDRSFRSARIASAFGAVACGDVVRLGIRDESADAVVLDGVAHHTPDPRRSLDEAARVLRRGGVLYFAVYKDRGYYPFVYRKVGGGLRWLYRRGWGRSLGDSLAVPVYGFLHRLRRGRRRREAVRNLFADYFLTPVASFHSRAEIETWGRASGLSLEKYDSFPSGNCHLFVFRKAPEGA